jgi:hypothetical protein
MSEKENDNQNNGKEIKITHSQISLELEPSLRLIGDFKDIPDVDTILKIVKTQKNVDEILNVFRESRKKVMESFCETDENGSPKLVQKKITDPFSKTEGFISVYVFKNEETEKQASLAVQKLDEKEVDLVIYPVSLKEIKTCKGLTPNIIRASREFITM